MSLILNPEALGKTIRLERKQQNMTQAGLAEMAGVGVRFVRELEHGKPGCQIGLAFRVLSTLGITLSAEAHKQ